MQHVETIAIDSPALDVWELVGNPSNWSRWMPDLKDVRLDGPVQSGAGLSYTSKGKQRTTTISRFVPGQEIAIEGNEKNYDFSESITVHGLGAMTSVSMSMGFEPKVWWASALTPLMLPIKKIGMGRPMIKTLNSLRETAEGAQRQLAA